MAKGQQETFQIHLARHLSAGPHEIDLERPLNDEGVAKGAELYRLYAGYGEANRVTHAYTGPAKRTRDTVRAILGHDFSSTRVLDCLMPFSGVMAVAYKKVEQGGWGFGDDVARYASNLETRQHLLAAAEATVANSIGALQRQEWSPRNGEILFFCSHSGSTNFVAYVMSQGLGKVKVAPAEMLLQMNLDPGDRIIMTFTLHGDLTNTVILD